MGVRAAMGLVVGALLLGHRPAQADPPAAPAPETAPQEAPEPHRARFLDAHVCPDGHWDPAAFDTWRAGQRVAGGGVPGLGRPGNEIPVTALVLRAYFEAGFGSRRDSALGTLLAHGICWLARCQDAEGLVGWANDRFWATGHALATDVLVQSAVATGVPRLTAPAQRAIDYLAWSVGRGDRAWDEERGPGNLPPRFWALMALHSARLVARRDEKAGNPPTLRVSDRTFEEVRAPIAAWAPTPEEVAAGAEPGPTPTHGAAGVLARIWGGEDPKTSLAIRDAAARSWNALPKWDVEKGTIDVGAWYVGTLAAYAVGGDSWTRWSEAMRSAIVDTQRLDGASCEVKGSWDPHGPWADEGGRVFSTAMLHRCLHVYYRYDRCFCGGEHAGAHEPPPAPPPPPDCESLPPIAYGTCD